MTASAKPVLKTDDVEATKVPGIARSSTSEHRHDLSNLDILRGIAVLTVVVSHLLQMFSWKEPFSIVLGRTGVLIFFVHTTLVLMMSMERSGKTGWALFRDFYIRRVFRVYPLSILIVLALVPTMIPDAAWRCYHWVGWTAVLNDLLLVSNIAQTSDITAPIWSLTYEVQMYLALPFLYLIVKKLDAFDRVILWSAAMFCTDISLWAAHGRKSLLLYLPCFVAGALAFRTSQQPKAKAWIWPLFVIGGIVAFSMTVGDGGFQSESAGWIACLILAAAIPKFQQVTSGYVCSGAKLLARYSYGIYLIHMPLIWICFVRFHGAPDSEQWALFLMLIAAIPVLLYHGIEAPMISIGWRVAQGVNWSDDLRQSRQLTAASASKQCG